MSRNLDSTTKLTEFAPLSPETEEYFSLSSLVNKIFGWNNQTDGATSSIPIAIDPRNDTSPKSVEPTSSSATLVPANMSEGRSLPDVVKRISSLLALRNTGRQSYNDTDLKQYWMPDSVSKECYDCREKFTTFRRRHHCRVCGQIFCSKCCNQEIPGKIMNYSGNLRVCVYCAKVVLTYIQSPDMDGDLSEDLRALQEDLQTKFGGLSPCGLLPSPGALGSSSSSHHVPSEREESVPKRKPSVGYQEEKFTYTRPEMVREEKSSLRGLVEEVQLSRQLPVSTHRYRLRAYHACFPGNSLVTWFIENHKAANRIQGIALGQAMLDASYIEGIEVDEFCDSSLLYRFTSSPDILAEEDQRFQDLSADSENEFASTANNIRESSSIFNLDLNVEDNTAHVSRPAGKADGEKSGEGKDVALEKGLRAVVQAYRESELPRTVNWNTVDPEVLEPSENQTYFTLKSAFDQHINSFLRQMLNSEGVSQNWAEIVSSLAHEIVSLVCPDISTSDDMDIRRYVQFKKVSGGDRQECNVINGVCFSKNLTHRSMRTRINNPRILLLECAITYERVEGKLLSLEPVLMQERDFVGHTINRIANLKPDVILVGKTVCRLAQEQLRSMNVSIALNVKTSVLERIARVTDADILTSIDANIRPPKLGSAGQFYIKSYTTENGKRKTLIVFENCPKPNLGCTVLLRGGSNQELAKIKRVIRNLVFAHYNYKYEFSYLMDSWAQPPSLEDTFFELDHDKSPQQSEAPPNTKPSKCAKCIPEDKIKINTCAVSDFSDPLHLIMNSENEETEINPDVSLTQFCVTELPLYNKFRKALEDNILSVSPYIKFCLPYLESEAGRQCPLRTYFGSKIYWSSQFSDDNVKSKSNSVLEPSVQNMVQMKEEHEFVRAQLTEPADSLISKALVASFRASGGRIPIPPTPHSVPPVVLPPPPPPLDVLDPENHQRLLVLFSSYSPVSTNAPSFCVDPWVFDMELYGRLDIPLGAFLERYCFSETYSCTSRECGLSMVYHTRRFVHDGGAVLVTLRKLDTPFLQDGILAWNWCKTCNKITPVIGISPGTWALSFAKYLELRFHGHMYTVRALDEQNCPHSLHHDYVQYFGYKNLVSSFTYHKVSVWEISLPPLYLITLREPHPTSALHEELKTWSHISQQIFAQIHTKLTTFSQTNEAGVTSLKQQLQKDQGYFKNRVDEVQVKLSSSVLDDDSNKESVVLEVWGIEDCLVLLKRLIAEKVDEWNTKLNELDALIKKKKSSDQKLVPMDDAVVEGLNETDVSDVESQDQIVEGEEVKDEKEIKELTDTSDPDVFLETEEDVPVAETDSKPLNIDKLSVKTILSQLLPASTQNFIQSPFGPTEHYCLPLGFSIPVVVYEREPSSIIAYALSSHDYRVALEQITSKNQEPPHSSSPQLKRPSGADCTKEELTPTPERSEKRGMLSFLRSSSTSDKGASSRSNSESGQGNPSVTSADFDEDLKSEDNKSRPKSLTHNIDVNFSDSMANFKVKVYFAEDFCRLRKLVLPGGEESYVRSLSRCVQWAASGGKSGSNFSKTKDDRFVLKEMSRIEIQIFVDFAPQYFMYMETCVHARAPTLLGKILGVYRVSYRSTTSGATCRSNLLVMEHLFHARPAVTNKFDLKGSIRNRLVDPSARPERETVLLDENLINMTCDSPLYIQPHSKAVLMRAIHLDTQFLATQSVMDYSLLVGLDHTKKELVVGIIDYIRTFTWDKKLETMVKKYGLLGQGKQPTIISPDEYRTRFIAAMHRYFLPVPDRWTGLGQGVDCC